MRDSIKVYLRNSFSPYSVIDSSKSVLDSLTFSGSFIFSNVTTGNYYIELGTLNNFEQKLHNLKLFYNQYIDYIGTGDYEKLTLKFVNQVVATKRIKNGEQ